MPPITGHKKLAEAVFTSIHDGSYAADQDVASAELPSTALESLSLLLEQARVDVKNSISELSRLSATDIDGWIAQAKQLRQDIAQSEKQSQKIVLFAEGGRDLQDKAQDALAKVKLLDSEVAFNDVVVDTLKDVQNVKKTTDNASTTLQRGQLLEASKLLRQAESQAIELEKSAGPGLNQVIGERVQKIRSAIIDAVEDGWSKLIMVDTFDSRLTIHKQIEASFGTITLERLAETMDVLDLLQNRTSALAASIDATVLTSLLQNTSNASFDFIHKGQDTIELVKKSNPISTEATLRNIQALQLFCQDRFPDVIQIPFIEKLNSRIVDKLLSSTLAAAVPLDLSGLAAFQRTIEQVRVFAKSMEGNSKTGAQRLFDWVADAPNVWLSNRSKGSLNSIRQLLKRGLGRPRQVERVETQIVMHNDGVFALNGNQEDWDARWSDEEEQPQPKQTDSHPESSHKNGIETEQDDEDTSGWGFDEEEEEEPVIPAMADPPALQVADGEQKADNGEENDGEAWGWGDDPDSPSEIRSPRAARASQPHSTHAQEPASRISGPQEREITLRETYHITALPEQVLDIIIMAIEDADSLSSASSANPIASAARNLYLLPGFLLSMFRASAPTFYGNDINGSMFLYNDSLYLSEQLQSYIKHHQTRQSDTSSLSTLIEKDVPNLVTFGKRAYGKDMESKRTTLVDLLDGAQGFSNCTQEPFASQCDLAISSVIDYLRQIHGQWARVLSRSALLQSIGSLLTTITNKMIVDIEDMSDISEPESQRLASFCKSITTLEDLFLPEPNESAENNETAIPLTAGYTKTWLRFQYLSNILESSLIDIKYLWTEGELSMEFSVDEVVDLIEALFADSDHRRRAIADIHRNL